MKNKLLLKWSVSALLLLLTGLAGFSQKTYKPSDLPKPIFDSTGFIIDPDKRIDEEWFLELIGTRETYFFPRFIEPVCVRVDKIKEPEDLNLYADQLVTLWDLEKKTNGRFVLQVQCKSKQKVVFRIGSRIKPFYSDRFLRDLAKDIADVHLTGDASGTGDFVALQKMGDHIFKEIAFDADLTNYSNNTGIHSVYPDRVEKSNGELRTMAKSVYEANDPIFTNSNPSDATQLSEAPKSYFAPLSQEEITKNFNRINTRGSITHVDLVPNAREINNGHVTDPHLVLTQFAVDTINAMLNTLETKTGYQVAVVCLNSIGDNDPRMWGTDLFNHWGVGEKESDNGLLMLLVIDQHAIEFITGRGTEGVLTDASCYDIQQNEMVPYFKGDDYVTGMIRGVQATCDFLYGSPPLYSSTSDETDYDETYNYDGYEYESEPFNFFESGFFYFLVWSAVGMTAAWIIFLVLALFNHDLHKRYHLMKFFSLGIWPFVVPVPFIALHFLTKTIMNRWRNTIRFSEKTGEEMHKLGDMEEDKHLSKGQVSEEKVKSIDYDVWVTPGGTDVLVLSYKKWFSKYNKCPSCSYKTYFKEYDRTIVAATYDSSGTGERSFKCEHCGHRKTERYTIPRKTRSSSSSGGSSYGGGGGYSRSYSGGSSYGGGSSRGGGAGSRW